jgi:hypothetical protein
MYREDTHRKDQRRTCLGVGSAPSGLDEDGTTIISVATPVASEDDVTYKTLNR